MSAEDDEVKPPPPRGPVMSEEDRDAVWWLARWIGIPLAVVVATYYSEPLFRGSQSVERVPATTRQQVHPYPFPADATGPNLAPPEVPREPKAPELITPQAPGELPTASDIVANPISQPEPRYPNRALEAGKEGLVRVRITIAPDGRVSNATVVSAEPRGWFDAAAVNAVMRWRYQPPGRTLETEAEIEFKLK